MKQISVDEDNLFPSPFREGSVAQLGWLFRIAIGSLQEADRSPSFEGIWLVLVTDWVPFTLSEAFPVEL